MAGGGCSAHPAPAPESPPPLPGPSPRHKEVFPACRRLAGRRGAARRGDGCCAPLWDPRAQAAESSGLWGNCGRLRCVAARRGAATPPLPPALPSVGGGERSSLEGSGLRQRLYVSCPVVVVWQPGDACAGLRSLLGCPAGL